MAAARGMVLYLLSGFSIAVLSVLYTSDYPSHTNAYSPHPSSLNNTLLHYPYGSESKELKFSWRIVLATVIGFLGSACGTVGGVGGVAFVPMLTLIVGFDTKSAAALSKCMIMGASASSVWYNLRVPHPCREVPILDYDLALLFQPMLMLGITIGVALSVVFPYWLITVLIIILFLVLIDTEYEPLIPREEKTAMQILRFNLRWKRILVLLLLWAFFLLLQIIKNDVAVCSTWYWLIFLLQFPLAFGVFGFEGIKLYKESKQRRIEGNTESVCEATLEWTPIQLAFCGLCGILGGTVGGLLGSGGGFILVLPPRDRVSSPALYLISVSVLAASGTILYKKTRCFSKRASLIVFILSAVIFASALTMGKYNEQFSDLRLL
ncbi:Sulfite exporter TauE/SafE family protein 4 [Camellia lanceoleosa]|uniref:Sulfite exporter TauE/SafE family protein 4 n=1 Tax=Camellia lanceoleosa TaxID=1840588 RepID=A0ACC0HJ47_9ERIC|nr:Sulfite exporter TauE/SafE family protein 4 [Camellia lanceoleosa]